MNAELLLEQMIKWFDETTLEKVKWIIKKKSISSISIEEIQYIKENIKSYIATIYQEHGEEYTNYLLKKIDENGNKN